MILLQFFKKETQLLIKSDDINLSDIDRIDIVVDDNNCQRVSDFS